MPVLYDVIAVPAIRAIRDIPTEVRLGPDDGMPDECVLSLDNVTLVPRDFFTERICRLAPARLEEVCGALAIATGCA